MDKLLCLGVQECARAFGRKGVMCWSNKQAGPQMSLWQAEVHGFLPEDRWRRSEGWICASVRASTRGTNFGQVIYGTCTRLVRITWNNTWKNVLEYLI